MKTSENIKETVKKLIPCELLLIGDFYLLPLFIKDTGSAMFLLLNVMPIIAVLAGLLYRAKNSFSLIPAISAFVLFIPTIFIFFNESAFIYAPLFALLVLAGNLIGRIFYNRK